MFGDRPVRGQPARWGLLVKPALLELLVQLELLELLVQLSQLLELLALVAAGFVGVSVFPVAVEIFG